VSLVAAANRASLRPLLSFPATFFLASLAALEFEELRFEDL